MLQETPAGTQSLQQSTSKPFARHTKSFLTVMHTHSTVSNASVREHCVANADQPMSSQQRLLQKPSVNIKSWLRAAGKASETAIDIKGVGRERTRPFCPQMVIKQSRQGWFSSVRNTLPHRGGVKYKNTLIHELNSHLLTLYYIYWSF